jgi:hypothetical protein
LPRHETGEALFLFEDSSVRFNFDFVLFFTAKTQRAQRQDTFIFPLRGWKKKKINRYAIFFTTNAHRACYLLFSGVPVPLSGVNGKQQKNNLSGL